MSFDHFNMLVESVLSEETSVSSEVNDNLSVKLSDFENSECCCLKKSSNKKEISLKRVTLYTVVLVVIEIVLLLLIILYKQQLYL